MQMRKRIGFKDHLLLKRERMALRVGAGTWESVQGRAELSVMWEAGLGHGHLSCRCGGKGSVLANSFHPCKLLLLMETMWGLLIYFNTHFQRAFSHVSNQHIHYLSRNVCVENIQNSCSLEIATKGQQHMNQRPRFPLSSFVLLPSSLSFGTLGGGVSVSPGILILV